MFPKKFAWIGGIVMLALGVIALIPGLEGRVDGLPGLRLDTSYGLFLGMFPMNILNKVALIVFGLAGILASRAPFNNLPLSIHYSRLVAVALGLLTVLGLIPQTNTLFGYWPLFGGEILAHAVFAILGAYFGWALTAKVPPLGPETHKFREALHSSR